MSETRDRKRVRVVNVYGPDGKHELTSWANAGDLVRNCGWTLTKPNTEDAKKPVSRRGKKGTDDAPAGAAEVQANKPNYPDPNKRIEDMTRTELLGDIHTKYGVELDGNRQTEYMVWWAQQLSTGMAPEEVQVKMEEEFGAGWGIPGFIDPSNDPAANLQFVPNAKTK